MAQRDEIEQVLREMREAYWRGIEEDEEGDGVESRDYLLFRLGGERFGVPTPLTREVLRIPPLVRVPQVAEHFRGVINLRGEIVAVTDLRPLLGLAGRELPTAGRLIIVEAAGLLTALLTEAVEGIRTLAVSAIEPATEGLAGFSVQALAGQLSEPDGLLQLLDLEYVLGRPEFVVDIQEGTA